MVCMRLMTSPRLAVAAPRRGDQRRIDALGNGGDAKADGHGAVIPKLQAAIQHGRRVGPGGASRVADGTEAPPWALRLAARPLQAPDQAPTAASAQTACRAAAARSVRRSHSPPPAVPRRAGFTDPAHRRAASMTRTCTRACGRAAARDRCHSYAPPRRPRSGSSSSAEDSPIAAADCTCSAMVRGLTARPGSAAIHRSWTTSIADGNLGNGHDLRAEGRGHGHAAGAPVPSGASKARAASRRPLNAAQQCLCRSPRETSARQRKVLPDGARNFTRKLEEEVVHRMPDRPPEAEIDPAGGTGTNSTRLVAKR